MAKKIITVAAIKGGTGKTTTAAAIAQMAAKRGKRVLCIDLDPQANLTDFLDGNPDLDGSYDAINNIVASDCIQSTEQGIDLMAGRSDLQTERTRPGSAMRLQEAIKPLRKKYDLIIIDTPPQMGELTFNALQASDGLIIPLETDRSSLEGLYQITDIAKQIKGTNSKLSVIGCLLTRYDSRAKLNRYLHDVIEDACKDIGIMLIACIRPGIAIREAQSMQQSLFDYAPKSKPADDYRLLYEQYIEEA